MSETTVLPAAVNSLPTGGAELIKVLQLPVIFEQLDLVKADIQESVKYALSLECTEDSYKQIKDIKARMNADLKRLEALRISVKKEVMKSYDDFEERYKECVTNVYKPAEAELSERINAVTDGLKSQKKEKLEAYFDEYVKSKNIEFLTFDRLNLNITMNVSEKSLKKAVAEFVDKVAEALEMINTQEFAAEILVEFKKTLNVSQAILEINNRHKAVEEEEQRRAKLREIEEARRAQSAKVEQAIIDEYEQTAIDGVVIPHALDEPEDYAEELQAPVANEVDPSEQTVQASFTVTGTRVQLKELVNFLKEANINYEQF